MKGAHKTLLAVAALAAMGVGARWTYVTYRIVRPTFSLQMVETSTYRAWYPAHWEEIDTKNPRLGDTSISFSNHAPYDDDQPPWDRPRWRMRVTDKMAEGRYKTLDAAIEKIWRDGLDPTPIHEWSLSNGMIAKTWTHKVSFAELVGIYRWVAFEGPNGHVYTALFAVPPHWKTRWRYEYLFRNILASMEFKPAD
ncbi:MAG: hypothetical protein ABII00_00010 [Elusimicrobiota bacterium]